MIAAATIALILAALLGFAGHRAGLCTVRAVAEVLSTRRAFMLAGLLKASLWVAVVTVAVLAVRPWVVGPLVGWRLTAGALVGGLVFGIGAGLNRACAISSLSQLASGNLGMASTLAGFVLGLGGATVMVRLHPTPTLPIPVTSPLPDLGPWLPVLAGWGGLWALWELVRLIRSRPAGRSWLQLLLLPRYRISTAVALFGIAIAVNVLLVGTWAWSATIRDGVEAAVTADPSPSPLRWGLLLAVIGGMTLSAIQGGRFHLRWRPRAWWLSSGVGGVLMGVGTVLVPGGNDALLFHAIPALSPHALPGFATMLLGIGLVLALQRRGGGGAVVDCRGDLCRVDQPPG
jgi:uncharacterized membrane protein YedE/YeeE